MTDDVIPFPVKQLPPKDGKALRLVNRYGSDKCMHRHRFEVDESANTVKCLDCGADINPIWALVELTRCESMFVHNYERYMELKKKVDKRLRTVCEHCKRMTRIRGL